MLPYLYRIILLFFIAAVSLGWGFFGHKKINYQAVFLLPPEMMVLYKKHISFLEEHAVDPDKRRYAIPQEAARHYIDLDHYGKAPYDALPRKWKDAVARYSEDTLMTHGIVPWWIETMLYRLTEAFKDKNQAKILKLSAEIGHYIADAHVPLHATKNYNGQLTNQHGIHGFWESRVPELLAEKNWDFFIGTAYYIAEPQQFIWQRVLESAAAADTVLAVEKKLTEQFPADRKYAFEERNGMMIRTYSADFTKAYDAALKGMIERRMQQSIEAVAAFWFTAWVNAGQPPLTNLTNTQFTEEEQKEFEVINMAWKNAGKGHGREHE